MTVSSSTRPGSAHPGGAHPDLARLRFEGSVSQGVFRSLLDTLSHPGRVVALDRDLGDLGVPFPIVPALALAAGDTSFAVAGTGAETWAPLVADATGGRVVPIEQADLVVVLDPPDPDLVMAVKRGTALVPEAGARVFVSVPGLAPAPSGQPRFVLSGPGVVFGDP